jgi:hypothetical protein
MLSRAPLSASAALGNQAEGEAEREPRGVNSAFTMLQSRPVAAGEGVRRLQAMLGRRNFRAPARRPILSASQGIAPWHGGCPQNRDFGATLAGKIERRANRLSYSRGPMHPL